MTIAELLKWGTQALKQMADLPALEAQVLLAHVLGKERSFLYAYPEKEITQHETEKFQALITRRLSHEPIAYLLGHKEFWSLDFVVTEDTLIPRADTELLVKTVLEKLENGHKTIIDLGTGCGAIACALAHERKDWEVIGLDISEKAVQVATRNAQKLNVPNVSFIQSDWFSNLPQKTYDAIVGNPPYIRGGDVHLIHGDLPYEPQIALTPGPSGLEAFMRILKDCHRFLKENGLLAFEHGFDQREALTGLFEKAGFKDIETFQDYAGKDRVTLGRKL